MIADIARDFLARGGKRLRPRLCKAAYVACGGTDGKIDQICEAVECFHKASLIHDDIEDGDEERYGKPTTWKEYGIAKAIAAGDWLVAYGYRLIAESGMERAFEMMRATVKSHLTLCEGQGDDLDGTSNDYEGICARKTGEAFALAAELGATAAGGDAWKFRRYGMNYGILFQLRDDAADGETHAERENLEKKYEHETAVSGDECAIGVW